MESVKLDCGCTLEIEDDYASLQFDDIICTKDTISHASEVSVVTGRNATYFQYDYYLSDKE